MRFAREPDLRAAPEAQKHHAPVLLPKPEAPNADPAQPFQPKQGPVAAVAVAAVAATELPLQQASPAQVPEPLPAPLEVAVSLP